MGFALRKDDEIMLRRLHRAWCRFAHDAGQIKRPDGPTYQCRRCLERFEVPWANSLARDPRPRAQIATERVLADGRGV